MAPQVRMMTRLLSSCHNLIDRLQPATESKKRFLTPFPLTVPLRTDIGASAKRFLAPLQVPLCITAFSTVGRMHEGGKALWRVVHILSLSITLFMAACIYVNAADRDKDQSRSPSQSQSQHDQNPEGGGDLYVLDPTAAPVDSSACPSLGLRNHVQQTGSWCWAASTQTVIEYIERIAHTDNDQCNLVNEIFKDAVTAASASEGLNINCCLARRDNPNPSTREAQEARRICDSGMWPDAVFYKYNYTFDPVLYPPDDGGLPWPTLKNEMCADRPILFVVRWVGGGRHTALIGGYRAPQGGDNYVEVYDPGKDGFGLMTYSQFFLGQPGDWEHEVDYTNIKH